MEVFTSKPRVNVDVGFCSTTSFSVSLLISVPWFLVFKGDQLHLFFFSSLLVELHRCSPQQLLCTLLMCGSFHPHSTQYYFETHHFISLSPLVGSFLYLQNLSLYPRNQYQYEDRLPSAQTLPSSKLLVSSWLQYPPLTSSIRFFES